MERNKKYNIEEFYVGELYLYTNFANFISEFYNLEGNNQVQIFSQSGAINFQEDMESRHIDYQKGREYTGFLTIFYKQGNKYICLHNGVPYQLKGANFIENLVPLSELLPQVNSKIEPVIGVQRALELFDILFKNEKTEIQLYNENEQPVSDFCVGDIVLRESYHQESNPDSRRQYINLPHHVMLDNSHLTLHSFEKSDYVNRVYRCLFLRQDVDLYNVNNHQFYNSNEDAFDMLISFEDYILESGMDQISKTISIPKALKKFKRTI